MPFPNRLPFHPAYSGVSAKATTQVCDPATASTIMVPEANKNTIAIAGTCPKAVIQRIGLDEIVANLSAAERRELKRRLQ